MQLGFFSDKTAQEFWLTDLELVDTSSGALLSLFSQVTIKPARSSL